MYFGKCREIRDILKDLRPDDQSTINRFSEFLGGLVTEAKNQDMGPMATLHGCLGLCARDDALYSDNADYKPALAAIVKSVSEVIGGLQAIIDMEKARFEAKNWGEFCPEENTAESYVDRVLTYDYAQEIFGAMADAVEAFMNKPTEDADPAEDAEDERPQG